MKRITYGIAAITILAGFALSACQKKAEEAAAPVATEAVAPAATVAGYTCPMHPEVQQAAMGKCPTCGMDLVQKQ